MTIRFMPPRVPLVDLQTGTITREWYRLFQNIMDPQVTSDSEALELSYFSATGAQLDAQLYSAVQDAGQSPPVVVSPIDTLLTELSGLREAVAELTKTVEDMRKGLIVL
jgi:hypothetical protein